MLRMGKNMVCRLVDYLLTGFNCVSQRYTNCMIDIDQVSFRKEQSQVDGQDVQENNKKNKQHQQQK